MRVEILEVLEGHFGKDKDITVDSHMMDDLGGDEFDILDVIVQAAERRIVRLVNCFLQPN